MKRSSVILVTFALCASLSAGPAKESATQAALRKTDAAWSKVASTKNVDKFVAFYADDAVVLAPNEPVCDTKGKIRKAIAGMMSLPNLKISWNAKKVEVSSNLGYCWGFYELSFKGPDGKAINDKGKTLSVWRRQANGAWKCILDTWNSNFPAGS